MFVESNYTRLVRQHNVEPTTSNELIVHVCLVNSHSEKIKIKITITWGGPPLEALIKLRDPSFPTAEMATKMKGLIKGLRYISQIFGDDSSSEEEEMQIGNPTDVKHVAHIGWDGPSVVQNSPSWMDDFSSKSSQPEPDLPRDDPETQKLSDPPKQAKKSRRHNSAANSIDSPTQDLLEGTKPSRRNKNLSDGAVVQNSTSARETPPSIPKQAKKKKPKDSSGGGSTRSRRKDSSTLTCTASSDDPGSGGP